MSNSNRIKLSIFWRREDAKNYAEIPIKEARPFLVLQRFLEICFIKKWVEPWQVILYIVSRDRAKMMKELEELNRLLELKHINNGGEDG